MNIRICALDTCDNVLDHQPKFCCVEHGRQNAHAIGLAKAQKKKQEKVNEYNLCPKHCNYCDKVLPYEEKHKTYCNQSCSASKNNTGWNRNGFKKEARQTPKRIYKKTQKTQKTLKLSAEAVYSSNPKTCVICTQVIAFKRRHAKTCGDACYSKLVSNNTSNNPNCGGSTKQYISYFDSFGKLVSLDSNWELVIAKELDKNKIKWNRPNYFKLSTGRRYTPDFYLPDFDVYLEPKGIRGDYKEQLEKISLFEKDFKTQCIVISNKNNLNWQYINLQIRAGNR